MSLARKATIFTVAWFLIYVVAYFVFIAPSLLSKGDAPSETSGIASVQHPKPKLHANRMSLSLHDPHVPRDCAGISDIDVKVGIVVTAHDERPFTVVQTIKSIIEGSDNIDHQIIVVDDHSVIPIREWDEWGSLSAKIKVIRTNRRVGVSESRNFGLKSLSEEVAVVIFLDSGVIVSDGFVSPLVDTLRRHPHAVVYPAIDVLDDLSGTVMQASNAVAAIDWSLRLKWEDLDSKPPAEIAERLPLLTSRVTMSSEVASPVAPSSFAVNRAFLRDIGGLATSSLFSPWGPDSIELSLRVWLCTDGMVIRQPCSRVAVRRCVEQNQEADGTATAELKICPDSGTQNGYTQYEGDKDAVSLAALWLGSEFREDVLRHRMIGRLPYTVRMRSDARHPDFVAEATGVNVEQCNDFNWYLQKVYSGLQKDRDMIQKEHAESSSPAHIERMLWPLLNQYQKRDSVLQDEKSASGKVTAPIVLPSAQEVKEKQKQKLEDNMKFRIRDENLCANVNDADCEGVSTRGECKTRIAHILFMCPKACGFCSDDNKLCTDFYLNKCPAQAANGDCTKPDTKEWMETNCRHSCKVCRRPQDPQLPAKIQNDVKGEVNETALLLNAERISPYVAQEQWISGKLPDPYLNSPCALRGTRHAALLDHIHVTPESPGGFLGEGDVSKGTTNIGNRIFCATYTMEEKHKDNVATMKASWAKRCDGWIAFSTTTDVSIPALRIYHEGPEAYNNMWQKSRSIWKYIAHHFMNEFDWFLIGGDDMYYIMSNLRQYLLSDVVTKARNEGKGLFIGRKFSPPNQIVFNSGGAGYILDRAALKVLAEHIDGPPCFPHQVGFWEDVNVANCLLKTKNIVPFDTRDEKQRERFHPFTPGNHLDYRIPKNPDWYAKYNPELKVGLDCCAPDSISFHYAPAEFMNKLHNYIYNCDAKKDLP